MGLDGIYGNFSGVKPILSVTQMGGISRPITQEETSMADRIKAISAKRPKIALERAVTSRTYVEQVTRRTTLSAGVVRNVQESEIETLISMLLDGRPVHTGIGIYTP